MEEDIKKFKNGRQPKKFDDGIRPQKFGKWKTTSKNLKMKGDLIFFENEDDLKNKATKKKYDFETFHVVRSNQNNKI